MARRKDEWAIRNPLVPLDGTRIRQLMNERGLSYRAFARLVSPEPSDTGSGIGDPTETSFVRPSHVQHWIKRGKEAHARSKTVQRIAARLGVTPAWLRNEPGALPHRGEPRPLGRRRSSAVSSKATATRAELAGLIERRCLADLGKRPPGEPGPAVHWTGEAPFADDGQGLAAQVHYTVMEFLTSPEMWGFILLRPLQKGDETRAEAEERWLGITSHLPPERSERLSYLLTEAFIMLLRPWLLGEAQLDLDTVTAMFGEAERRGRVFAPVSVLQEQSEREARRWQKSHMGVLLNPKSEAPRMWQTPAALRMYQAGSRRRGTK
jgi:hypothetical protein